MESITHTLSKMHALDILIVLVNNIKQRMKQRDG